MSGAISDGVVLDWLNSLGSRANYLSLHFALPMWADPGASEVFDPGYARANISWTPQSNRSITNAVPVQFNLELSTKIVAVGLRAELTGQTLLAYALPQADTKIIVPDTGLLTIPSGEIVIAV